MIDEQGSTFEHVEVIEFDESNLDEDSTAASEAGTDDGTPAALRRQRLPVIPLRGTVVFPSVAAPIAAGREKTMRAIEEAMNGERLLFAVAQRDAEVEDPAPESLYRIGTVCRIAQMQKVPGGVQMVIQGTGRAAALEFSDKEDHLEVVTRQIVDMEPLDEEDPAFAALYKEVNERASEVSRLRGVPKEIVDHLLGGVSTPGELADLVAFLHRARCRGKTRSPRNPVGRESAPEAAVAPAATDRTPRGAGRDPRTGAGRARRTAARSLPARTR